MKRVDSATLEQCRRNPATAAQDGLVVCLECGLLVRRLTRSPKCHARYTHNLDATAYLAKWPGAPLQSAEAEQIERDTHSLYLETHADELKGKRRDYRQRPEVKAHANEYARGRWPAYYATHLEAERERGRDKHQRFRERDNERQRQRYQENLEAEQTKNREKQRKMRELARAGREAQRLKNLEGLDLKTGLRISLMAHRLLEGQKPYGMRLDIYPDSNDPFNATKRLRANHAAVIEAESQRISTLPADQQRVEADDLKTRVIQITLG